MLLMLLYQSMPTSQSIQQYMQYGAWKVSAHEYLSDDSFNKVISNFHAHFLQIKVIDITNVLIITFQQQQHNNNKQQLTS